MTSLGALLLDQKRYDEAEPILIEALELHRSVLGDKHQDTLIAVANVCDLYVGQERYSEARPMLADAIEIARDSLPADHWLTAILQAIYGSSLVGLDEFEEAEQALLAAHRVLAKVFGPEYEWTIRTITSMVVLYERWGKPEKAAEFRSMLPAEVQGPVASD